MVGNVVVRLPLVQQDLVDVPAAYGVDALVLLAVGDGVLGAVLVVDHAGVHGDAVLFLEGKLDRNQSTTHETKRGFPSAPIYAPFMARISEHTMHIV